MELPTGEDDASHKHWVSTSIVLSLHQCMKHTVIGITAKYNMHITVLLTYLFTVATHCNMV